MQAPTAFDEKTAIQRFSVHRHPALGLASFRERRLW